MKVLKDSEAAKHFDDAASVRYGLAQGQWDPSQAESSRLVTRPCRVSQRKMKWRQCARCEAHVHRASPPAHVRRPTAIYVYVSGPHDDALVARYTWGIIDYQQSRDRAGKRGRPDVLAWKRRESGREVLGRVSESGRGASKAGIGMCQMKCVGRNSLKIKLPEWRGPGQYLAWRGSVSRLIIDDDTTTTHPPLPTLLSNFRSLLPPRSFLPSLSSSYPQPASSTHPATVPENHQPRPPSLVPIVIPTATCAYTC